MRKGLVAFGLSVSLAVGCAGSCFADEAPVNSETETVEEPADVQAEDQEQDADGLITRIPAGEHEVLLYYPMPNAADTLGVVTICTAPTILVFGDTAYDEAGAAAFAQESGLAEMAAEEGASVCFVNPIDETWSDKDANAYADVAACILSTTQDPIENGVVTRLDFETQEEILQIAGNQSRIYVYGIGQGANYVANTVLKNGTTVKMFYGYDVDVTPSACSLEGCTEITAIEKNDIPVVSVNNSDEINEILQENCGSVSEEDSQDYIAQYNQVMKLYRRQCGVINRVYDWEAEGIVESVETCEVATSPDNAGESYAGTETHPISYVVYYAEDLDVTNGNVPLVLCFHGGGNSALHETMMTDWPMIGKQNGFITCSVDQHSPNCTATEIIELIDILKSKYSIDESRIYASGFSMGGVKCWDLYEQYPEVFAALAPMDASNVPGTDTYDNPVENPAEPALVPLFYVGGEISPLEELPGKSEKVLNRMKQVFKVNEIADPYEVEFADAESWENKTWGIDGDLTYDVTDTVFTDSTLTVSMFRSEDGKYYTALALASNQAHEIYARNSWAAWDFMSQFSRNADGSISIADVTYAYQADDGSVVDNSYNQ